MTQKKINLLSKFKKKRNKLICCVNPPAKGFWESHTYPALVNKVNSARTNAEIINSKDNPHAQECVDKLALSTLEIWSMASEGGVN